MLAPAFIPVLLVAALIILAVMGAWPFGAIGVIAVSLSLLAIAIALVRVSARMGGPEPPTHHSR